MQETQEIIECPKSFWEGFDACLEMVLNSIESYESNDLAKMSVWEFIEDLREQVTYEAELYKTDG